MILEVVSVVILLVEVLTKDKSYAKIDGVLQEYDLCTTLLPTPFIVDESIFQKLGVGVVDNVCKIKNYGNKEMVFYRLIKKEKKR